MIADIYVHTYTFQKICEYSRVIESLRRNNCIRKAGTIMFLAWYNEIPCCGTFELN